MKVKWGAIVVDGRNKIGGHVASKNRAGAYFRTKVTPVNPQTSFQVDVRANFTSTSQSWRGLTQTQRNAWDAAVSNFKKTDIFGDSQVPSGFNLYKRLNGMLLAINVAAITTPPTPVNVSVFDTFSLTAAAGTPALTATVTPATLPTSESVLVFATAPQSPGKTFVKNQFRVITVLTSITAGSIDLTAAYQTKFGTIGPAGQKIFVKMVHVNESTGQASQAQEASAIVAA